MQKNQFVVSLHGLRGIAVLYVLFSHLGNAGYYLVPISHNAIGKVGVWIFFGLSAYLLTSRLIDVLATTEWPAALKGYFVHRVFRIYPLFIVVLALHALIGDMTLTDVFKHLALVKGQGELWAISTEFQYYLVIPVVALLPRYLSLSMLALALVGSVVYGTMFPESVWSNGLSLVPKAAAFLLASAIAVAKPSGVWAQPVGWMSLVSMGFCTFLYRHINVIPSPPEILPWLSLATAVSVAGLIYALLHNWVMKKVLSLRPIVWIGEISFSIYLLHMFVIRSVGLLALDATVTAWLAMFGTIVVASASFLLIEKPGISLGGRLGKRLMPGITPDTQSQPRRA